MAEYEVVLRFTYRITAASKESARAAAWAVHAQEGIMPIEFGDDVRRLENPDGPR